jgi:hypothetical protein
MHGSPHDSDYDKDMKLPFKTTVSNVANTLYSPKQLTFMFKNLSENAIEIIRPEPSSEFYLNSYISNVWRPPALLNFS